jgi:hypothetical protein
MACKERLLKLWGRPAMRFFTISFVYAAMAIINQAD